MSENNPVDPASPSTASLPVLGSGSPTQWAKAHHILLGFLGLGLLIWLLSGIYTVKTGEVAIVERFGVFVRAGGAEEGQVAPVLPMEAGLHYHLPYPIDVVYFIPIQQTQTLVVDDFNSSPAEYVELKKKIIIENRHLNPPREVDPKILDAIYDPYLITGDKNVIHAALTVNYHVADPEKYIISASAAGRDNIIRQLVNHVLISEVAHWPVDDVLAGAAEKMQHGIQANAQVEMDRIALGIQIDGIQMSPPPRPPAPAADAFNAVIRAKEDKETSKLQGEAQAKSIVTQANAQAQSTLFAAQTEKEQQILEAQGEASRFASVLPRFRAAPDLTRISLFYDTMNQIMSGANRIIWVKPGQNTTIVLDPPAAPKPGEAAPGQNH